MHGTLEDGLTSWGGASRHGRIKGQTRVGGEGQRGVVSWALDNESRSQGEDRVRIERLEQRVS